MARLLFYSTLIVLLTGCADSQFLEWLGLQKKHDNKIPVTQAGENIQITIPEDSVYLDGSLSADPDGTLISFLWEKISGPDGAGIPGGLHRTGKGWGAGRGRRGAQRCNPRWH